MKILAIDTSCDETSAAVTEGVRVLSNVISSQVRYHKKYGGVVPFLAQRLHKERIDAVIELALSRAGVGWHAIDALVVTYGPGLAPALEVGLQKARELSAEKNLPIYPVNHMAGHIASAYAQVGTSSAPQPDSPILAVLVSGKHTELAYFERWGSFQILGQTLDDALGEAYDKVARMLGLGYPGGRLVATLAKEGNPAAYELPVPMRHSQDLNLSYSGLKNAVRLLIAEVRGAEERALSRREIADICAAFQEAAQESLLIKLEKALKAQPEVKSLVLAGGVAANPALRAKLRSLARAYDVSLHLPANLKLCTDNAAMIGVAAWLDIAAGRQPVTAVDRKPSLALGDDTLA